MIVNIAASAIETSFMMIAQSAATPTQPLAFLIRKIRKSKT
jgi:hypothetical protein